MLLIFVRKNYSETKYFLSKNQKSIVVQHDWDGQHHQFQITPVRSADGKLTKDHMNSMESQRYYNNIKDKTIHLKEKEQRSIFCT